MSAGSSDGTPAAGCFGGRGGGSGGGGVGCFGGKPERAPLLDKTRHEASTGKHGGRSSGLEYQTREDTVSEQDDAEYGVLLGTSKPGPAAFSEGDSPSPTRGSWQTSTSEVGASSIRPIAVVLAIAAAPFTVGLTLGYPRAAAPTLLCSAQPDDDFKVTTGCATEQRLAYLENLCLAGAALGALLAGRLVDLVGRRGALRLPGALAVVGWVFGELVFGAATRGGGIGRFLVGVSAGASTAASTLLAAEVASPANRGALVAACQLALASGLAVTSACALAASTSASKYAVYEENKQTSNPQPHFRQVALFAASCSAAATASMGGVFGDARVWATAPESPRWLAARGRENEVVKAIATARGLHEKDTQVVEEAKQVIEEVGGGKDGSNKKTSKFSPSHLLTRGFLSKQLLKCLALVLVSTLGGLTVPLRNASVASVSGFEDTERAAFSVSCAKLLGVSLSAFLLNNSNASVGRRVLWLCSVSGMVLVNVLVVCSLVIAAPGSAMADIGDNFRSLTPLAFTFAHAIGAATVPWLVATEAFPHDARGAALGVIAAAHWSFHLDIGTGFRVATEGGVARGVAAFGVFGILGAIGLSLVAPRGQVLVLDAEGKTLEQARNTVRPKTKQIGIAVGI